MDQQGPAPEPLVTIYTDGSCLRNPGPGGYGVVLRARARRRELSGGYRRTTNGRMELTAAIAGLRALKKPSHVRLWSDAAYLVDAMRRGWARQWAANDWRKRDKTKAANADLWAILLELCVVHTVAFERVPGHAGEPDNERCHRLAIAAAKAPTLIDEAYEAAHP